MATTHWSNHLVQSFPIGQTTTVPVEVDPEATRGSVTVLASRVRGLVEALGPVNTGGHDPLADETDAELLWLLDPLHRVVYSLAGQEDRLLTLRREKGVSLARLGSTLEMSAPGIKKRLERIERAEARGMHSAAYVDHAED